MARALRKIHSSYKKGDFVKISGARETELNGLFQITSITEDGNQYQLKKG